MKDRAYRTMGTIIYSPMYQKEFTNSFRATHTFLFTVVTICKYGESGKCHKNTYSGEG